MSKTLSSSRLSEMKSLASEFGRREMRVIEWYETAKKKAPAQDSLADCGCPVAIEGSKIIFRQERRPR